MKLIVLPFAGGNKYSYSFFRKTMPTVEIINLEYPGRGARMKEPLLDDIDEIVDDIHLLIKNNVTNEEPFSIYGHSMGGLIGYLVSIKMQKDNEIKPKCLIVSGRYSPTINNSESTYDLPSETFWQSVFDLEGTPVEIANEEKLRSLFEPILRNDFKVIETYSPRNLLLLETPIEVLYGQKESIDQLSFFHKWNEVSSKPVNFHEFEGGHFFILNKQKEVSELIQNVLERESK
ncbi:thioesterase II family protein [Flavobacterium sp.]|uniref:thioesterase II family protein n=1 Tax=Flavobacterium sp. TaxID=239 RepID=UPI003D6B001C